MSSGCFAKCSQSKGHIMMLFEYMLQEVAHTVGSVLARTVELVLLSQAQVSARTTMLQEHLATWGAWCDKKEQLAHMFAADSNAQHELGMKLVAELSTFVRQLHQLLAPLEEDGSHVYELHAELATIDLKMGGLQEEAELAVSGKGGMAGKFEWVDGTLTR
jgi:hypothetical protein